MSTAKFNNKFYSNSMSASAKKPFCKVCQDAGKTESEYTSHFVRSMPDKNGKTTVTCPVLAVNECRYCYELGHTTKFCPVIEENNRKAKKHELQSIQAHKRATYDLQLVGNKIVKPKVSFAVLDDGSDEEKQVPVAMVSSKVEEIPALGMNKDVTQNAKCSPDGLRSGLSWAAIAEKPAAQPVYKPVAKTESKTTAVCYKNWADYSDSDSDDERKKKMGASDSDDERKKRAASFVRRTDTTYNDFVYDDNIYYPEW